MNYHWSPFRAKSTEATLTISDGSSRDAFGGAAGQETMLNFVQVEPYDE